MTLAYILMNILLLICVLAVIAISLGLIGYDVKKIVDNLLRKLGANPENWS